MAAVLLCGAADAQTKSETRNYNKTVAKPSLKAYDSFLKKYPSSVYAGDIAARRDTLLNISPYGDEEAAEIIRTHIPAGSDIRAFAVRKNAVDRIYAMRPGKGVMEIFSIEKAGDVWIELNTYRPPLTLDERFGEWEFADQSGTFRIRDEVFFRVSLLASTADRKEQTYVGACYSPDSDYWGHICFRGKNCMEDGSDAPYHISGRYDDSMSRLADPQMRMILADMKKNPHLEEIPDNEYYTELAIQWWIENNPDALTGATHLKMNQLDKESTLVQHFEAARGRQESARYAAAIMDIDGYTVIVARQKSDGEYMLAWAEPECRDSKRDRLLNNIYFSSPTVLTMNYYEGRRIFRYRLNLASKQLRR